MPTRTIFTLLVLLLSTAIPAAGAPLIAGYSAAEALRLGEAMYQKGVLPSGKPMTAIVQGDIEVTGTMITCSNCHMRSGLGSVEGNVLSLPTNGARLYAPLQGIRDIPGTGMARFFFKYPRPEYTDESLAAALRNGVDPTGRVMIDTMPRYVLDDREMEVMIYYLKNLSSGLSPGVAGNVIRFATVVTEEVGAEDRAAMLGPLTSYVRDEWNANVPVMVQAQGEASFRAAALDVWDLKGPSDTWGEQLEAFYTKQPVFALLGGMTTKNWAVIHRFCEKNRIPCVFPVTDLPEVSGSDWYTLYFSKGHYQEGETAAKYLARVFDLPQDRQVVQVFRNDDRGSALARGFAETWTKLGKAPLKKRVLAATEKTGKDFWKDLAESHKNAVLLLWLGPEDLAGIDALGGAEKKPSMLFVSSTMLGMNANPPDPPLKKGGEGEFESAIRNPQSAIPDSVRDFTFITYPNRLPDEQGQIPGLVEQWLKVKKISSKNLAVSSKVYFLTRMVSTALANMRGDAYRDYFLDLFDIQEDQSFSVVSYPRLSFGPGQRYASKGCYIVTLTKGEQPKIVKQSEWVVY
jgi:hypothetical protein